jgi:hypothetical protein
MNIEEMRVGETSVKDVNHPEWGKGIVFAKTHSDSVFVRFENYKPTNKNDQRYIIYRKNELENIVLENE